MTTKPGKRQLTINGLLACGWAEVKPAPSRKYVAFDRNDGQGRMFVGGSGALRWSPTGAVVDSRSMTDDFRHKAYQEIGNPAYRFANAEQAVEAFRAVTEGKPILQDMLVPLPTLAHEIRQQITAGVCGPEFTDEQAARKSRLERIRGTVLANKQARRGSFDGMESADIAEYNRAMMFGDNDEAFPSQEEWSRIVD